MSEEENKAEATEETGAEAVTTENAKSDKKKKKEKLDKSIDYNTGNKDKKGQMIIRTTDKEEFRALKNFHNVKKGDIVKMHPITGERLTKKKLVEKVKK